jgi:hypothetical protein
VVGDEDDLDSEDDLHAASALARVNLPPDDPSEDDHETDQSSDGSEAIDERDRARGTSRKGRGKGVAKKRIPKFTEAQVSYFYKLIYQYISFWEKYLQTFFKIKF